MKNKITTTSEINSEISKAIMEKKETIDNNVPLIGLKGKAIKFIIDTFTFIGIKFAYVIVNDIIYFRAKDVAEFLGYTNPNEAIRDHVSEKYKKTLEELLILQGGSETLPPCKINKNDLKVIYITEAGLYQLIFGSKKKEADEFRQFVFEDILPNIRKNGSYSINDDYIKDTSKFISFFDTHNTIGYDNTPTIYIGVVGIHDDVPLFKFGKTNNIMDRLAQHKKEYGEQFIMLSVYKTFDETNIENSIREYVKTHNLQCKISNYTELFTSNNISQVQLFVYNLISQNGIVNESNTSMEIKKLQLQVRLEELKIESLKLQQNKQKETIEEPLKTENKCVYKRFLNECTKETTNVMDKVYSSVLYDIFKQWHLHIYPDTRIPSHKEFVMGLKKYTKVKDVRINNKTKTGMEYIIIVKDEID
jgi:prophage antirepressor-like protein